MCVRRVVRHEVGDQTGRNSHATHGLRSRAGALP